MAFFDFLKPKKSEQELMFEKMNKELFPNGDKQIDEEVAELSMKLKNKYPKKELKGFYFSVSALYHMAADKGRERIVGGIMRNKTISLNEDEADLVYDYLYYKSLSQNTGIEKKNRNLV